MSVIDPAQGKAVTCTRCNRVLFRICALDQNEKVFIPESVKAEFGTSEDGRRFCLCPICKTKNWIENLSPQSKEP